MKNKFKIKGAIFDLDGTLLNTMYVWDTLGERYLKSQNIVPDEKLKSDLENLSMMQAAEYFRKKYNISDAPEKIIEDLNKMIEKFYFYEAQAKDGAIEFINHLRKNGVKMCIATATERYLAENALKRLKIYDCFCGLITCSEVGDGKDNPLIFMKALEILGTDIRETYVFEDALYSAQVAHKAGLKLCGVYDSAEKNTCDLKKIVDIYIKSFLEAGEYFD